MEVKFPTGDIATTRPVYDWINEAENPHARYEQMFGLLNRHRSGDWGEVCPEDKQTNDEALIHGSRLLSVYTIDEATIWIITEADRSVTTILFPSDY